MRRRMCARQVAFAKRKSTSEHPCEIIMEYGIETHHPSERARFAVKTDEYEPSVKASTERFLPQKK